MSQQEVLSATQGGGATGARPQPPMGFVGTTGPVNPPAPARMEAAPPGPAEAPAPADAEPAEPASIVRNNITYASAASAQIGGELQDGVGRGAARVQFSADDVRRIIASPGGESNLSIVLELVRPGPGGESGLSRDAVIGFVAAGGNLSQLRGALASADGVSGGRFDRREVNAFMFSGPNVGHVLQVLTSSPALIPRINELSMTIRMGGAEAAPTTQLVYNLVSASGGNPARLENLVTTATALAGAGVDVAVFSTIAPGRLGGQLSAAATMLTMNFTPDQIGELVSAGANLQAIASAPPALNLSGSAPMRAAVVSLLTSDNAAVASAATSLMRAGNGDALQQAAGLLQLVFSGEDVGLAPLATLMSNPAALRNAFTVASADGGELRPGMAAETVRSLIAAGPSALASSVILLNTGTLTAAQVTSFVSGSATPGQLTTRLRAAADLHLGGVGSMFIRISADRGRWGDITAAAGLLNAGVSQPAIDRLVQGQANVALANSLMNPPGGGGITAQALNTLVLSGSFEVAADLSSVALNSAGWTPRTVAAVITALADQPEQLRGAMEMINTAAQAGPAEMRRVVNAVGHAAIGHGAEGVRVLRELAAAGLDVQGNGPALASSEAFGEAVALSSIMNIGDFNGRFSRADWTAAVSSALSASAGQSGTTRISILGGLVRSRERTGVSLEAIFRANARYSEGDLTSFQTMVSRIAGNAGHMRTLERRMTLYNEVPTISQLNGMVGRPLLNP